MKENNRAIVLGSGGFIGSHLVSRLRSQNCYVVGVDFTDKIDLTLGLEQADQFHQIALPDQRFYEILHAVEPDILINAAGPASVSNSFLDSEEDFRGSVDLCAFVLEALRKTTPGCRFLLLSSAAVYGNPIALPIKESAPLKPISPYGYHKMMCETLAQEYFEIYGIETGTIRIFSAYGPGLRKQILWDICHKAIENDQVTLFGSGEETRDFIHIQDILQAIQIVLNKSPFHADIYNVANGREISIKDLARKLLFALNMGGKEIRFSGETKPGDPKNWRANIEKIQKLGYLPSVNLEKGIFTYATWLRNAESTDL